MSKLQGRSHGGEWGGPNPPTCIQNQFGKSFKTEKNCRGGEGHDEKNGMQKCCLLFFIVSLVLLYYATKCSIFKTYMKYAYSITR